MHVNCIIENSEIEMDYFELIKNLYQIKEVSKADLSAFDIVNQYYGNRVLQTFEISNGQNVVHISLVQYSVKYYEHSYVPGSDKDTSSYFFVSYKLKNDFGRILIRPETFSDKLAELFNPIELDFDENRKFSSAYYVVSTDNNLARKVLKRPLFDFVEDLDSLIFETNGLNCLFRFDLKPAGLTDVPLMVKTSFKLIELLN